jgi:hypothetical protein
MPSFVVDLPATVTHLADARRRLREWLEDEVADDLARDDLLAVAGEFFLHVVFRTGGLGRARLVAERGAGGVRLSVTGLDERPNVRPLVLPTDPLATGALGRRLVEGCCDEVRVAAAGGAVVGASCYRAVPRPDERR